MNEKQSTQKWTNVEHVFNSNNYNGNISKERSFFFIDWIKREINWIHSLIRIYSHANKITTNVNEIHLILGCYFFGLGESFMQ